MLKIYLYVKTIGILLKETNFINLIIDMLIGNISEPERSFDCL